MNVGQKMNVHIQFEIPNHSHSFVCFTSSGKLGYYAWLPYSIFVVLSSKVSLQVRLKTMKTNTVSFWTEKW